MSITTTSGERFTDADSQELARLIFRRFGRDLGAATVAWRRLLQNSTTERDFERLLGTDCANPNCGCGGTCAVNEQFTPSREPWSPSREHEEPRHEPCVGCRGGDGPCCPHGCCGHSAKNVSRECRF